MSTGNHLAQKAYWEKAGAHGYGNEMFASGVVERHVNDRLWQIAVDIGVDMGLGPQSYILDLGCGDGAFANKVLASRFRAVDGFDFSGAAIERARAHAPRADIRFQTSDIVGMNSWRETCYDGAFLIGILHHIKAATPSVVRTLREVTSRVIVLEPNGSNVVRKLLEFTPSYRAAGEDSFRTTQLARLFAAAGFRQTHWRRLNLFPNFTPRAIFDLLKPIEPIFERTPGLRALCTVNIFGFVVDGTKLRAK